MNESRPDGGVYNLMRVAWANEYWVCNCESLWWGYEQFRLKQLTRLRGLRHKSPVGYYYVLGNRPQQPTLQIAARSIRRSSTYRLLTWGSSPPSCPEHILLSLVFSSSWVLHFCKWQKLLSTLQPNLHRTYHSSVFLICSWNFLITHCRPSLNDPG